MIVRACPARSQRHGATVVELALVLPFLCFLFVIAVDYARIFYFGIIMENCARNGAYYASNYPNANYLYNDIYGYKSMDEAVFKDAANIFDPGFPEHNPKYTVSYSYTLDGAFQEAPLASGYVKVSMTWTFHTVTNFPGVPNSVAMERSVIMRTAPPLPQFPKATSPLTTVIN